MRQAVFASIVVLCVALALPASAQLEDKPVPWRRRRSTSRCFRMITSFS